MTVQTHTTRRQHRTSQPTKHGAGPHRAAGRTIVASVAIGALTALVLVLVAFPGATEATTTGLLLLAFGFGWALMAFLTVRRTRQPQRWAYVPAAAMGATGAALVVLDPGNQTMTALNWVWPPLMVALAVWIFTQVRRSVTGAATWVLIAVTSVLVLTSVGATYANISLPTDDVHNAAPGQLYNVAGHRLHLDCHGHGSPTVVLSNGLGGTSARWARITGPIAATTRVCAYDRAGQGWSDDAASPRDGVQSAKELHTLLAKAGEHGPYVLVGHSTGGTHAMTYAARYPDQVAGLVLLDSSSPQQFTQMPDFAGLYAHDDAAPLRLVADAEPPRPGPVGSRRLTAAGRGRRDGRQPHLRPEGLSHPARRSVGAPSPFHAGTGAHHLRRSTTRRTHRLGQQHGDRGLGRRAGPARRTLHQLRPPHRGLHPRGPARGRPPGCRVGPKHQGGHLFRTHRHTACRALTRAVTCSGRPSPSRSQP